MCMRMVVLGVQKSEVLQLPPKVSMLIQPTRKLTHTNDPQNEVIVPVSMTPLQKEVYRSILSEVHHDQANQPAYSISGQNVDILRTIALNSVSGSRVNAAVKKSNMNNILMQLRKYVAL